MPATRLRDAGGGLTLARHEMTVEVASMTDALSAVDRKPYHRFPHYRVFSIIPMDPLPIPEETVEFWRDRA